MMIANAVSIKYIEQFLWFIIGILILKEKVNFHQICGMLLSISGIVIVIVSCVKFTEKTRLLTYFSPVFATVCWTISSNFAKVLIVNRKDLLIHMLYYYIFHIIVLVAFVITAGYSSKLQQGYIDFSSYEFLLHILSMTFFYKALKYAPISLLAPFVYVKLIFSALLGYFVFSNNYSLLEYFAYSLIIVGGIKTLHGLHESDVYNNSGTKK